MWKAMLTWQCHGKKCKLHTRSQMQRSPVLSNFLCSSTRRRSRWEITSSSSRRKRLSRLNRWTIYIWAASAVAKVHTPLAKRPRPVTRHDASLISSFPEYSFATYPLYALANNSRTYTITRKAPHFRSICELKIATNDKHATISHILRMLDQSTIFHISHARPDKQPKHRGN